MQNRKEHLDWCKQRANDYVEQNDLTNAFASFQSDMSKHQDTANHLGLGMGTMLLLCGDLSTQHQMKEWIKGFN